ncbi:MAG: hypothetical protein JWN68_1672 [Nocardioides sp.]|jgi:hypothetical protein|nr:hypothetical protein [Nocardioides sp.]
MELDDVIRDRTARYDSSFVSADPTFAHAHITLLGPWLDFPTHDDLLTVADVLASEAPFSFELDEVGEFGDGTLHLLPEPAGPFHRLITRLAASFPQTPPYAGRYADVVPHLTFEHRLTGASAAGIRSELGDRLPVRARAERVDLQWWANHDCHVQHSWRLGR